jgi:predicted nuclease of restriction endonuclease-like (RecB) superfamily
MPAKKKLSKKATVEPRLSRGRTRNGAMFPAPSPAVHLPADYATTLQEIKTHLRSARVRAILAANPIVIESYWNTGKIILARQKETVWGAKVIDRLAADLQAEFPDMRGLTRRNLFSMRAFAEAFPTGPIVKQPVSQLPWGHLIRLIQMVKDPAARDFYIREILTHGWSRSAMEMQIHGQLHLRAGKALNNFTVTMPSADSDLATQLFKDPYLFDFLGTADPRREAEVEQALMDHVQRFLLELGAGFAFVGRRVHLEVSGDDFYLDLLFYHLRLRRYVVVELKARPFQPGDVGQINLYRAAVDDLLRHPDDQPTIGLLLCRGKNKLVVEYALSGLDQSIAVSDWKTQITESLPPEFQGSLPTVEELEAELSGEALPEDHPEGGSL